MAPYSFLTVRELVSKSHDGVSFKKSTQKSRANKHNEMSTNMASKFLKKIFWNSCASLCQFKNINRMNTTRYPSVLNTKGKSTRFAGDSINLSGRHASYSHGAKQRSLLPHLFAVFGVVYGGNSNENENSAKSGISQDETPPVRTAGRPTSSRCTNGRFGKMKQQKNIGPMREGLKSWRLQQTLILTAKRKLVLGSATDENEHPPKYKTRSLKVKYNNSSSIALVHAESMNLVRKSVNLNRM